MKIANLFICSFFLVLFSYSMPVWAVGYDPSEEAVLANPDPLPPAEEIIGVIGTPEEANNRGKEIQLAHGGCENRNCDSNCGNDRHGYIHCDPDIIVVPNPPVITAIGNVCRGYLGYCYTTITSPVGTPCHCISYNLFGLPYVWLQGIISTF